MPELDNARQASLFFAKSTGRFRHQSVSQIRSIKFLLASVALLMTFFSAASLADGQPKLQAENRADYRLGPGDVIRILVFQNPDLQLETRVSENGAISYPLLGSVEIGGLSIGEAEKKLARLLKEGGFVIDPQLTIALIQVRGNQVAVLGQVNRPGRYPLETAGMRLTDVLALAGGVVPGGADQVILSGSREGKPFRKEIDIPSMFLDGKIENDVPVQNGDIFYVHRAAQFYVYGEVQRPGSFRLERDMTLMQALAQGGGLTLRGTQRGIRVYRRDATGKVQKIEPDMQDNIRADDVIYVRESLF
jgi:polysaccharide export outer membrane protein